MKTTLILILMVLCHFTLISQNIEKHKFSVKFDLADFCFETTEDGTLSIVPQINSNEYSTTVENYCMPVNYKTFAFNGCKDFIRYSCIVHSRPIRSNVDLTYAPDIVSTDGTVMIPAQRAATADGIYPASRAQYTGLNRWDNVTLMHFETYPFIYDEASKELSFVDSISLNISVRDGHNTVSLPFIPSYIKDLPLANRDFSFDTLVECAPNPNPQARVDYALITTEKLKSAFFPLINWKRTKGVYAEIYTIEDIESEYDEGDIQFKIKSKLYDLYCDNGLKYALLGGDDTVVPVRGCFGQVNDTTKRDYSIPTDLYYSCFNGSFDWDKNNNKIYGEMDDCVDLSPSIYVSRLPVRNKEHVHNYLTKSLEYERTPVYDNKMLMGGCKITGMVNDFLSDADAKGDKIANNYILPYWSGKLFRFYDTSSSFDYNIFNRDNLQSVLSTGFSFIDISTHGNQTAYIMQEGKSYRDDLASTLINPTHSFIITSACLTNAFDTTEKEWDDPCLSESFIRSRGNNIVGYIGSSRSGWDYGHANGQQCSWLGPSSNYKSEFYRELFKCDVAKRTLGQTFASSKMKLSLDSDDYNAWRWLQFSINLIGDPEMHIFTETPQKSSWNLTFKNGICQVNTNENNYNLSISKYSSLDLLEISRVYTDISGVTSIRFPEICNICMSKPGMIPNVAKVVTLQNQTISQDTDINADVVVMGSSVNADIPSGDLIINSGKICITSSKTIIEPNIYISDDVDLIITF